MAGAVLQGDTAHPMQTTHTNTKLTHTHTHGTALWSKLGISILFKDSKTLTGAGIYPITRGPLFHPLYNSVVPCCSRLVLLYQFLS